MIENRSAFFRLEEQGIDMQVELGDDGMYPMMMMACQYKKF